MLSVITSLTLVALLIVRPYQLFYFVLNQINLLNIYYGFIKKGNEISLAGARIFFNFTNFAQIYSTASLMVLYPTVPQQLQRLPYRLQIVNSAPPSLVGLYFFSLRLLVKWSIDSLPTAAAAPTDCGLSRCYLLLNNLPNFITSPSLFLHQFPIHVPKTYQSLVEVYCCFRLLWLAAARLAKNTASLFGIFMVPVL